MISGGTRWCMNQLKDFGSIFTEDNFAFGQDYAKTCRMWADRLRAQKPKISELGYGESFFRNWQYYLEICAASFAVGHTNVVQVEMAHA